MGLFGNVISAVGDAVDGVKQGVNSVKDTISEGFNTVVDKGAEYKANLEGMYTAAANGEIKDAVSGDKVVTVDGATISNVVADKVNTARDAINSGVAHVENIYNDATGKIKDVVQDKESIGVVGGVGTDADNSNVRQVVKPTYGTLGALNGIRDCLASFGKGAASVGGAIGKGVTPGMTSFAQDAAPVLTSVGEGAVLGIGGAIHYGGVAKDFAQENFSVEKVQSLSDAYELNVKKDLLEAENANIFLRLHSENYIPDVKYYDEAAVWGNTAASFFASEQDQKAADELFWGDDYLGADPRKMNVDEYKKYVKDIELRIEQNEARIAQINEKAASYGSGENVAAYLGKNTRSSLSTLTAGIGAVVLGSAVASGAGVPLATAQITALATTGGTYGSFRSNEGTEAKKIYDTRDEYGNRKYTADEAIAEAKPIEISNAVIDGLDMGAAGLMPTLKVGGFAAQTVFDIGTFSAMQVFKDYFKKGIQKYRLGNSEENDEQE